MPPKDRPARSTRTSPAPSSPGSSTTCPARAPRAERGELAFGTVDSWLLWQLTGGARARHRRHQRLAHPAAQHPHRRPGTTSCWQLLRHPARPAAAACARQRGSSARREPRLARRSRCRSPAWPATSRPRSSARPALAPAWPRTPTAPAASCSCTPASDSVRRSNGLLTTAACAADGHTAYALEGSVFIGGAVVQWLRDGLALIRKSAARSQALAASVPDNGRRAAACPPSPAWARRTGTPTRAAPSWASRAAPRWRTSPARRWRASPSRAPTLLDAMSRDAVAAGGVPVSELRVDGGAGVNDLLMQFQADLLGVPVVRPAVIETTALGAAYLAGLHTGLYGGLDELSKQWRAERTFHPTHVARTRGGEDGAVGARGAANNGGVATSPRAASRHPPEGGGTKGPAKPVPRCPWMQAPRAGRMVLGLPRATIPA
ncbi:MAG: FGGY-family carbohydrate kinase [Bryobacterales bacterium]|nr:FGGY-family carbohydrate kinase [Bryobacterales bacterium]